MFRARTSPVNKLLMRGEFAMAISDYEIEPYHGGSTDLEGASMTGNHPLPYHAHFDCSFLAPVSLVSCWS